MFITYNTLFRTLICFFFVSSASVLSPRSVSAELVDENQPKLNAAINVEDKNLERFAISVTDTMSILIDRERFEARTTDEVEFNFLFASGNGFLDQNRISRKALGIFSDQIVDQIVANPANSESCSIVPITLSAGSQFLLAVHDPDSLDLESGHKCLSLTLAIFAGVDLANIDGNDWQKVIALTISKLTNLTEE